MIVARIINPKSKLATARGFNREKRALKSQDKIALRLGKVLNQFKVNKYYNLEITEEGFSYQRKLELIAQETAAFYCRDY